MHINEIHLYWPVDFLDKLLIDYQYIHESSILISSWRKIDMDKIHMDKKKGLIWAENHAFKENIKFDKMKNNADF